MSVTQGVPVKRPVVTASHTTTYEREEIRDGGNHLTRVITTPGVHVEVTFDLHDHERALDHLEVAVADVRAQIEETNHEEDA